MSVRRRLPAATRRRRILIIVTTAALAAAVVMFALAPAGPARTAPVTSPAATQTIRGAFHIHTTTSDGALDRRTVAAAAARAGLQFAIFTDHGDGTRRREPASYVDGVLCLEGVEISTNQGHYIAVDMASSPYPLGGDADAVVTDVARFGGFGVAAHPVSARPELAWSDWSAPFDGLEWINADSEWRDESGLQLARAFLGYLMRPAAALATLLDRPVEALRRWDRLTSSRRVVALAGHDAHGGFGAETGTPRGRRIHVPSYEASFRAFSVNVTLKTPPTGDAEADARALVDAIRQGRLFTAIDAIAAPAELAFSASVGEHRVNAGATLPAASGPVTFSVHAAVPAGASTVLLRNGTELATSSGGDLGHTTSGAGAYRVEVHVPRAPGVPPVPWIVSNPIYISGPAPVPPSPPAQVPAVPLLQRDWRVESDGGSSGSIRADERGVELTYSLRGGGRASQFVAFVVDLPPVPERIDALLIRGRARQPMRISAQLRFAQDGSARWRKSVYFDNSADTEVAIPVAALRPAESGAAMPPVTRATSLLLVVDLINTAPGAQGSLILTELSLAASR